MGESDRRKISLAMLLQILVNLLDLLGVAIIGVLGSLTITGTRSQLPGGKVATFLRVLNLENFSFQSQVAILGLAAVSALTLRTLLSIFFTRKTLFFLASRASDISSDLISKLLTRPILEIQSKSTQENLYAVTVGVSILTLGVIGSSVMFVADLSLLIIMLFGLFVVDPLVAITTMAMFGSIAFGLYRFMHVRVQTLSSEQANLEISSNTSILDALFSYREMLVLNRRSYIATRLNQQRLNLARTSAELQFMPNLSKYLIESTVVLAAIVISAIQFLVQDSTHAIGTLAVFLAAGSRIAPAVLRLQQSAVTIKGSVAGARITLDTIAEYANYEKPSAAPLAHFDRDYEGFLPRIQVSDLSFTYPDAMARSLTSVSFAVEPGEFLAIVGSSGAGKSTLVDVMLGVIEPDVGEVRISDKTPLDCFSTWPGSVAYVPQEVYLINGSIRENLAFGLDISAIDDSLYIDALKKSRLEFLLEEPFLGLETQIGEGGTRLSGGQRQRLGIARALISNPRLLVTDEATSALDSETENWLNDSIKSLRGKVTVVMIAHRLSTVRDADKVAYMDNGRIVAIGSFEEVRKAVPNFDKQASLMGL